MVAKNFDFALREMLKHEGGYVDHLRDPGGATNMGITRRTLADWRGVKPYGKLPKSEVKALKLREVKAIYKARYWDRIAGDKLPSGIDFALFDFAVNSGVSRAAKLLQKLLKVRRDGIVGVVTLGALEREIKRVGSAKIISDLCEERLKFLRRLKTFAIFGKGWTRRVKSVERVSISLIKIEKNDEKKKEKKMNFLSGYKTYIIGIFMILAAVAQFVGVDLPGLDGQSATELLLQAFAFIFLRKGIKGGV